MSILVRASRKFDFSLTGFSVIVSSFVKKKKKQQTNCGAMLILLYSTKPDENKVLGRNFIRRLCQTLISAGRKTRWIRNKFNSLTIYFVD